MPIKSQNSNIRCGRSCRNEVSQALLVGLQRSSCSEKQSNHVAINWTFNFHRAHRRLLWAPIPSPVFHVALYGNFTANNPDVAPTWVGEHSAIHLHHGLRVTNESEHTVKHPVRLSNPQGVTLKTANVPDTPRCKFLHKCHGNGEQRNHCEG